MAEKITTRAEEPKETPILEEQPRKTIEERLNESVRLFIPRALNGSEQVYMVAVNGHTYNIPRGREVTVPRYIAEVVEHALRLETSYEQRVAETYNDAKVQTLDRMI